MIPPHWWLAGPHKVGDAGRLLRHRNVPGAHVATVRRLIRIGPFSLMLFRYKPGEIDEGES